MRENSANLLECLIKGCPCVPFVTVVLTFCICSLTACNRARQEPAGTKNVEPVLYASPNPVPAGDINKPLGTTTITWDTGNGAIGDVYVRVDREPEKFMARSPSGTHEVRWIQFDSVYEFRLYIKKHSKVLAKLEVTRDD